MKNLLAFALGCLGVAAGFWGVLEGVKLNHLLGLLSLPVGLVLLALAFRLAPTSE